MYPGAIYRDAEFYVDADGVLQAKFVLILAAPKDRDLVARLLTSRPHGRPMLPPCFHGTPYPGYFLGIVGGALLRETWVDLRYLDDFDRLAFGKRETKSLLGQVGQIDPPRLRAVLECVAAADDTTRQQERYLRDALAVLPAA